MYSVRVVGILPRKGASYASIEDALDAADKAIATKEDGERVVLENEATGETYDERSIGEIRKSLNE